MDAERGRQVLDLRPRLQVLITRRENGSITIVAHRVTSAAIGSSATMEIPFEREMSIMAAHKSYREFHRSRNDCRGRSFDGRKTPWRCLFTSRRASSCRQGF